MNREDCLIKAIKWLDEEYRKYNNTLSGENKLTIYEDRIEGIKLLKEIALLHINNDPILVAGKNGLDNYECPHCRKLTEYPWMTSYCPYCGGEIDWTGIE